MSSDWKGEHLIRGVRPSHGETVAEKNRLAQVMGKIRGKSPTTLSRRKAHGRFVGAAIGSSRWMGNTK